MNAQTESVDRANDLIIKDNGFSSQFDYQERRRLEMKKRIETLLYRRDRLERELDAIKTALIKVAHQMQRDFEYKS